MNREDLERRRELEDRAIDLGAERAELQRRLRENTKAIGGLFVAAVGLGITAEHVARLVGVRRQSLYRWRNGGPSSATEPNP